MPLQRCYVCGSQLGRLSDFDSWMDRIACIHYRRPSSVEVIDDIYRLRNGIFYGVFGEYKAGQQADGSINFGLHSACLDILNRSLQSNDFDRVPVLLCELLHTMPFNVFFEDDCDTLHHEPEDKDGFLTPVSENFIFVDPMAVRWEDFEQYQQSMSQKGTQKRVPIEMRCLETESLRKLPPEMMSMVLQYLPTPDLGRLRIVSPSAAFAPLPTRFWSDRLDLDLPYADFIRGKANDKPEIRYKHLKQILSSGAGRPADSLRNLRRIYKLANRLCTTILQRKSIGQTDPSNTPGSDFSIQTRTSMELPLENDTFNISWLTIGQTSFITGMQSSSKPTRGCGFHYQMVKPLTFAPCSNLPFQLLLSGTSRGLVGLGFLHDSGRKDFVGGSSGPNISNGQLPFQSGDRLYLEFDGFKLTTAQVGNQALLKSPLMWIPKPPTSEARHTWFTPQDDQDNSGPYHICNFGGMDGALLDKLIQINAFYLGYNYGIVGLEFSYVDQPPLQWGCCNGTRYCRAIDGPGGERICSVNASVTDLGVVGIQFQTTGHRQLLFSSIPEVDLPKMTATKPALTGFYGDFRNLPIPFKGSTCIKSIESLSETLSAPDFVIGDTLERASGNGVLSPEALSSVRYNIWSAYVSSAPLEQLRHITAAFDVHGRLAGMRLAYWGGKLDKVVANFTHETHKLQKFELFVNESILKFRCSYKPRQGQTHVQVRYVLAGLELTTTERVIAIGSQSSLECPTYPPGIKKAEKMIYWSYNILHDRVFSTFEQDTSNASEYSVVDLQLA